jgi:hypothetical protein
MHISSLRSRLETITRWRVAFGCVSVTFSFWLLAHRVPFLFFALFRYHDRLYVAR